MSAWGTGKETAFANCQWYSNHDVEKGKPASLTVAEVDGTLTLSIEIRNDKISPVCNLRIDQIHTLEEQDASVDTVQLKILMKGDLHHQWLRFEKTNHDGTGFHDNQMQRIFKLPEQKLKPFPEEWKKELKVFA